MFQIFSVGHENFTSRLYSILSSSTSPSDNWVASPVSLSSVLALASVGARGNYMRFFFIMKNGNICCSIQT